MEGKSKGELESEKGKDNAMDKGEREKQRGKVKDKGHGEGGKVKSNG